MSDIRVKASWITKIDAEITRLRAENEKLREQLRGEIESHQTMTKAYENEIKMLKEIREITRLRDDLAAVKEERDRMREALEPFKQRSFDCGGRHILSREYVLVKWLLDARAALEGVTEPASPKAETEFFVFDEFAPLPEPASPWRDIESAPKDGTKFLAWFTWPGRHSVEMARWQDNRFAKQPKPYWTCDNERVHGIIATRAAQPTHWMPLPEPPK